MTELPAHAPIGATMGEVLAAHAAARPDSPALTVAGETWTYAELDEASSRLAAALVAAGLRPGDRVAMIARNRREFVAMHFAASRARVILVGINWRLSPVEVAQILADAQPALVILESEWEVLLRDADPALPKVWLDVPGSTAQPSYDEWLTAGDAPEARAGLAERPADPTATVMMLYTTGTTGVPKGVMLTETNMTAMIAEVSIRWRMRPDMRFFAILPLFHVSGTGCFFSTLHAGGEVVVPADPGDIARTIEHVRITHSALVPTLISQLVHDPRAREYDLSSLEVLIYGAAPSGGTLISDAMALMPDCGFTQGYGLTETCGGVAVAPFRKHGEVDDRPGTVGQPTTHYEFRIVDPATLDEVPAGTDGEVWVRGPQNASGYWHRPQETADAFLPDGWFRTGDIGGVDDDGYLYLKDRLKDMIISGGENVYSVEVESALMTHPDVLEAAVYGIPDARWGEVVKAVVAVTPGSRVSAEQLIEHTRTRLARYKCPRVVEFMDALPKSGSGKIIKHGLRAGDRDAVGVPESAPAGT